MPKVVELFARFCLDASMMNQSPIETALSRALIRWTLTRATPIADTPTSAIFKVEQNGRNFAALKILKPEALDRELRGARLMEWWGGEGAATVFDIHGNIIFMEWLDGGTLAEPAVGGHDAQATIALCTLIGQLHRQREAAAPPLIDLREHFAALFATDMRAWPHTARDLYARATGVVLKLFDKPAAQVPLHGDLHHDNIMSASRGWLAIDPIGILGDPHYEVANSFRNPDAAPKLATDPRRISALADAYEQRLGLNRKRLLGFAAGHSALSICWSLEAGRSIAFDLAMLPLLLSAYDQA